MSQRRVIRRPDREQGDNLDQRIQLAIEEVVKTYDLEGMTAQLKEHEEKLTAVRSVFYDMRAAVAIATTNSDSFKSRIQELLEDLQNILATLNENESVVSLAELPEQTPLSAVNYDETEIRNRLASLCLSAAQAEGAREEEDAREALESFCRTLPGYGLNQPSFAHNETDEDPVADASMDAEELDGAFARRVLASVDRDRPHHTPRDLTRRRRRRNLT